MNNAIISGQLYVAIKKYLPIHIFSEPNLDSTNLKQQYLSKEPFLVLEKFFNNKPKTYWFKIIQGNRIGFLFSFDEKPSWFNPWENK